MEVSNKALAMLLVLAIVVSIGGTMLSLGRMKSGGVGITGFDINNQTGNITVNITAVVAINITANNTNKTTLDFGTGYVKEGATSCTMNTSNYMESTCSGFEAPDEGIIIENIGNTNVTLDAAFTKNAASFIGGTNPSFKYIFFDYNGEDACNSTNTTDPISQEISAQQYRLCNKLYYDSTMDAVNLDLEIKIPSDSKTDLLSTKFNFTATKVS